MPMLQKMLALQMQAKRDISKILCRSLACTFRARSRQVISDLGEEWNGQYLFIFTSNVPNSVVPRRAALHLSTPERALHLPVRSVKALLPKYVFDTAGSNVSDASRNCSYVSFAFLKLVFPPLKNFPIAR